MRLRASLVIPRLNVNRLAAGFQGFARIQHGLDERLTARPLCVGGIALRQGDESGDTDEAKRGRNRRASQGHLPHPTLRIPMDQVVEVNAG